MHQATHSAALHGSRLMRTLAELSVEVPGDAGRQFSQRLGTLLDLADSIKLATLQMRLGELPFRQDVAGPAGIRRDFFKGREALIKSVLRACTPGASTSRIRFPQVTGETPAAEAMDPSPYLGFYTAQQSEMDYKVRRLQLQIRKDMSGVSERLSKLAALDGALADAMGAHTRRYFAIVPDLLAAHFQHLKTNYRKQLDDTQYDYALWQAQLTRLRGDIQGLLLAEAETRLLPVLGLVEALEDD
jgi:hypothetical protein